MKKTGFTGNSEKKKKTFFKRYGFYIALFALSFIIGLTSYYREYKKSPPEPEIRAELSEVEELPALILPKASQSAISTKTPKKTEEPVKTKEQAKQVAAAALAFVKPVEGDITVSYSPDLLIYSKTMGDWRAHTGVDFAAGDGAPVLASANGVVEKVYDDSFYGHTVVISHGGSLKSVYSSLRSSVVLEGQQVVQGEKIGEVGNSAVIESADGPHLHFSAEKDGAKVNPLELIDGIEGGE